MVKPLYYQPFSRMSRVIPLFSTGRAAMAQHFLMAMWVLAGVSASAAERAKITVVPFVARDGASDAATAKFTQLVDEELKARIDTVEWVARPKGAAAPSPTVGLRSSAEVMTWVDSGRKAFDELRFDEAVAALRRGLDGLLADPSTADFAVVLEAQVKLAAAFFRLGDEKEAKATLSELARLAPGATMPTGFPPMFQHEFNRAKKRLQRAPHGQVLVEGPSGSTAFVDGRDLGMVPAREDHLPVGLHYVRVESPRGEQWGQAIDVKPGVTTVHAMFVNLSSERSPVSGPLDPRVGSPVDEAMVSRLQALTRAAGAEFALFGVVSRLSDSQLQAGGALYSLKRDAVSLLSPVAFDIEVLTANTEVFKFCDEAIRRQLAFGTPAVLPTELLSRKPGVGPRPAPAAATSMANAAPVKGEDLEVITPKRKSTLTPGPVAPVPAVASPLVPEQHRVEAPQAQVKSTGVPTWVWVVAGVAVAGGAAVGGYFVVSNATRPVTGTVSATW